MQLLAVCIVCTFAFCLLGIDWVERSVFYSALYRMQSCHQVVTKPKPIKILERSENSRNNRVKSLNKASSIKTFAFMTFWQNESKALVRGENISVAKSRDTIPAGGQRFFFCSFKKHWNNCLIAIFHKVNPTQPPTRPVRPGYLSVCWSAQECNSLPDRVSDGRSKK